MDGVSETVFKQRYYARDHNEREPDDVFRRVAGALARVEGDHYDRTPSECRRAAGEFFRVMHERRFLPAGRTLANAGTQRPVVSNCVVLHMDDDMESIFETLKQAVVLQQSGCGIGFPFHLLRPAGYVTKRSGGTASGPVGFLKVFDCAFGEIKQQNRHGANMAVMRVSHPDILEFLHCKDDRKSICNFNISVGITDEFMEAACDADNDEPWMCSWGEESVMPRRVERDARGRITSISEVTMTARQILTEIAESAWTSGDPGMIFLDEVNRCDSLKALGPIECTNPCGEQPLRDGDVCNLGSINLACHVDPIEGAIAFGQLRKTVETAVRMLDNVIDLTAFPSRRVQAKIRENRRIGLGVMGWADALFAMRIPYDSDEAVELAESVMCFINDASHKASMELACVRGSFPSIARSTFQGRMRNAATTTVAPTGTTSMAFGCSSGIEPLFALAFYRDNILADNGSSEKMHYTNEELRTALEMRGIWTDALGSKIHERGTIQDIAEIPDSIKRVFVTAMDIKPEWHLKMQAAFQKHCDSSISKTINFPFDTTVQEIFDSYENAWRCKIKGFTVYRDNCRDDQVLNLNRERCKACHGTNLVHQEGCIRCSDCGNSYCGI